MLNKDRFFAFIFLMLCTTIGAWGDTPVRASMTQEESSKSIRMVVESTMHYFNAGLLISRDGKFAISNHLLNKTVRLWDITTGFEIRSFDHPENVLSMDLSSDNHLLITGCGDGLTRIWDTRTGNIVRKMRDAKYTPQHVAFSHAGTMVLMAYEDTVRILDVLKKNDPYVFQHGSSGSSFPADPIHYVTTAIFSPDDKSMLSATENGDIYLWDIESEERVRTFHGHTNVVTGMAWMRDGARFVSVSWDGSLRVWNVRTGTQESYTKTLVSPPSDYWAGILRSPIFSGKAGVAFSPDGEFVILSTIGTPPRIVEVSTGKELRKFLHGEGHDAAEYAVAFGPDAKTVMTGLNEKAYLWNIEGGVKVREFGAKAATVNKVKVMSDGVRFLTGSSDGTVVMWDLKSGKAQFMFKGGRSVVDMAIHEKSQVLATAGGNDNRAYVFDLTTGMKLLQLPHPAPVLSVTFLPNGTSLVTGSMDGSLRLWNAKTGRPLKQWDGHQEPVWSVAASPDGVYILSGSEDKTARLWNVNGKQKSEVRKFRLGGHSLIRSVAFSQDGGKILIANHYTFDANFAARLLDLNGAVIRNFTTTNGTVDGAMFVTFSKDGKKILASITDETVEVWDADSGKVLHRLNHHIGAMDAQFFQLNDKRDVILTAGADGTTRLWSLDAHDEIARVIYFRDGRWVAVDNDGRFDTNDIEELRGAHWVRSTEPLTPLPFEAFMRDYFAPQLLKRISDGDELGRVRALETLNVLQPRLEIERIEQSLEGNRATITVKGYVPEGECIGQRYERMANGIFDVKLFRNGKLVASYPKDGGKVITDSNSREATIVFHNIALTTSHSEETEFSTYAFNCDRVKSQTVRQTFTRPRSNGIVKRRAYIVSVGINDFEDPRWNLRFAANDARRLQTTLVANLLSSGEYSDVIPIILVSEQKMTRNHADAMLNATKSQIHSLFDVLAGGRHVSQELRQIPNIDRLGSAKPDDLVIFSFSTHGYRDGSGTFYMFPSDIGDAQGMKVTKDLLSRAISTDELALWLRDVDAGELVMIVDACQSAASVETDDFKPGPLGSRGLGQLAYDKGMRILAASQSKRAALENATIRQGLLTYALVHDGLEAAQADFQPQDQQIFLSEWLAYGAIRVPRLATELRQGTLQNPGSLDDTRAFIDEDGQKILRSQDVIQQPVLFDFGNRSKIKTDTLLLRIKNSGTVRKNEHTTKSSSKEPH